MRFIENSDHEFDWNDSDFDLMMHTRRRSVAR